MTSHRYRHLVIGASLMVAMIFGTGAAGYGRKHKPRRSRPAQEQPQAAGSLAGIDPAIQEAIHHGDCPGAVVLVGHGGKIVYDKAFGRTLYDPASPAMTLDTMFDMASLTKVIATTPSIMQLFEQGKIRFDDPVAKYWPEFGENGKQDVTVRELLTHYSGLPPDLPLEQPWMGNDHAMKLIEEAQLVNPPGTRFVYSDVNFETLGELVRRLSGEPLNVYAEEHVFKPLGMNHTIFQPPNRMRAQLAPTQPPDQKNEDTAWYVVNDPTSYRMDGVAGHAGLFSTAEDLGIYAQMILNGGIYNGVRILSPLTVLKMTTPQSPPYYPGVRGFGWDIDTGFSSNRGELFPVGSFGHTGWTGTSIWIDPFSQTYVILLTNAVHPGAHGNVISLRSRIATTVAAAYGSIPTADELTRRNSLTGYYELLYGFRPPPLQNGQVDTGIDVLESKYFAPLQGMSVGLITNQSGRDLNGQSTIDVLDHAPGVKLVAIFTPEHGLYGRAEGKVSSGRDPKTGLPVYSLYGVTRRPTPEMMQGINALVYDIQDVGVRYYTFIATMAYALDTAAHYHIPIFVLDRPDPINGVVVEGPILDRNLLSFVGYFPMPVRNGMTMGELAEMFNHEDHIGADLDVIRMTGWDRQDWFDETGLEWVNPSPNLRNLTEEVLYPGLGMLEGSNISVGRGTDTPFEVLGAPWIQAKQLSDYLNSRDIQGVRFIPLDFTPADSKFAHQTCHGISIVVLSRRALNSPELGVELASALYKLYPSQFEIEKTLPLLGSREVIGAIKAGKDPRGIELAWQQALNSFRQTRQKYLLY
jgi:uncharacterized protein YbbC (DUF1343 family)/CubicO group peptidase (beta-lactamase class C family)